MDQHLELSQLWQCPVDWVTVWKGSVKECLDHLRGKHDGALFLDMKIFGKFSTMDSFTEIRHVRCGERCEAVSGVRLPLGSPLPDLP